MPMQRLPALHLGDRIALRRSAGVEFLDTVGVPVLPMPAHVVAAATDAASRTYPRISRGWLSLREAVAERLALTQGLQVDPDSQVLVTHGAQHGMSIALRALLHPGDEVLVPAPTYFFDGMLRLAGLHPVYTPSIESEGWRHDVEALAGAISPATRAIVLCNPNNPTGSVPTRPQLAEILAIAAKHDLIVFSDESYERYIHDGEYVPLNGLRHLHDRIVTVTSLSKNYAFTNWRIGYVVGPASLIDAVHAALEWDSINIGDVPQAAAVAVLTGPQSWIQPSFDALRGRRDLLCDALLDAGVPVTRPDGGVFVLADLGSTGLEARALEDALLDRGLGSIAGDAFFGPADHVRLLYGGSDETVLATAETVARLVSG